MGETTVYASAPGKIILCGEHGVLYGKRCLATAIKLRTEVTVTEAPAKHFSFEALGEQASWTGDGLESVLRDAQRSPAFLLAVKAACDVVGWLRPDGDGRGLRISIRSELPAMRGLGSSASFSVAVSAAVAGYFGMVKGGALGADDLKRINELAYRVEQFLHGKASGIDNSVACYGGTLSKHGDKVTPLPSSRSVPLIVVDTGVARNTAKLVEGVRLRRDQFPETIDHILEAMDSLFDGLCALLQSESPMLEPLSVLLEINQGILEALGTGHEKVSEVVKLCKRASCRGVKITGAGGGGCLIALPLNEEMASEILSTLDAAGFHCFRAETAAPGVQLDVVTVGR